MQPSSSTTTSSGPPSFAGMLADLAAPEKKFPPARDTRGLDLDGLEDDIATLSYEQALRNHARRRPDPLPQSLPQPAQKMNTVSAAAEPTPHQGHLFAEGARDVSASRKSASVTVRMSLSESEQLRIRAAEAGMTVSAYLRSCAFEVETLRAQVKDALAQLRARSQPDPQSRSARRLWSWLRRA